jgi:FG-GAP repeat
MKNYLLLVLFFLYNLSLNAQIGVNSTGLAPNSSAMLDVSSNNKGVLVPRMNSTQRKGITNPATGLLVFDTEANTLYFFDGQNWLNILSGNGNPLTKRYASDGKIGISFGISVSISGDYAIIGAESEQIGNNQFQGSAYIFYRDNGTWTQQAKLVASDGTFADLFGMSVSISGDYAIVGASRDDTGINTDQGSAYVFYRTGTNWVQQAKLIASDGQSNDRFGSVSIFGDYAIVGASGDDIGTSTDQGSAYVFYRNGVTWTEQAKLITSDGASNDFFGFQVSISGDYILAGASGDDIGVNSDQGSAYIFYRVGATWNEQIKLVASDGAANDRFGERVAISGDYTVIGSYRDDVGSNVDQGSAYVFYRTNATTWTQQSKLLASDGAAGDIFGVSLGIYGDYILVGASGDDIGSNTNQGSAYLFKRNGTFWTFIRQYSEPFVTFSNYNFAESISIYQDSFIIGSFSRDVVHFGKIGY